MWFETGSFPCPAEGDTEIIGLPSTPKVVIFYGIYQNSGDVTANSNVFHLGFASGDSAEGGVGIGSKHGEDTSIAARSTTNIGSIYAVLWSGAALLRGDIKSLDANGFTVQWTTRSTNINVHYIAAGGDEVEANAESFPIHDGSPVTAFAHGLTGGAPTGCMILSVAHTAAAGTDADASLMFGLCDADMNQGVSAIASQDAQAVSQTVRKQLSNKALIGFNGDGTIAWEGEITSFDATNIYVTWSTAPSAADYIHILSSRGISCEVGADLAHNAAEAHEHSLTGSFTPKGLLMASISNAVSASVEDHAILSFGGGAASDDRRCIGVTDEDAQDTTDAGRISDTAAILQMLDENTAITDEIDLIGFGAGTFELDYSIGSANEFIFMALGEAAAPAGGLPYWAFSHYFKQLRR